MPRSEVPLKTLLQTLLALSSLLPGFAFAQTAPTTYGKSGAKFACEPDAPTGAVLSELGAKLGKTVILDTGISPAEPVGTGFSDVDAQLVLDHLLQKRGWMAREFVSGNQTILLIGPAAVAAAVPRVIETFPAVDPARLAAAFARCKKEIPALADCTVYADQENQVVVIEGPKEHADMAVSLLGSVQANMPGGGAMMVKRCPLRFGRVGKQTFSKLDGTEVQVDGIEASIQAALQESLSLDGVLLRGVGGAPPVPAGQPAGSTIFADPRTNSIIVTGTPQMIARVEQIIASLDVPTALVEIEGRILLTDRDTGSALGVRIGGLQRRLTTSTRSNVFSGPIGTDDATLSDGSTITRSLTESSEGSNLFVNGAAQLLTGETGFGAVAMALDNISPRLRLDLEITAIEKLDKGTTIAAPELVTLENQEAGLQIGGDTTLILPGSLNSSGSTHTVPTGVILKVTPHVVKDHATGRVWIRLDIYVENSEVDDSSTSSALVVSQTSVTTQVLVEDGHPVVLSGLLARESYDSKSAVPILGDIPIIGALFRTTASRDHNQCLTICVIPTVVGHPDPWDGTKGPGFEITKEKAERDQKGAKETEQELPGHGDPNR